MFDFIGRQIEIMNQYAAAQVQCWREFWAGGILTFVVIWLLVFILMWCYGFYIRYGLLDDE
jgi:hypothetical protein